MPAAQIPLGPHARADEQHTDGTRQVLPDLAYTRHTIVNVAYVGPPTAGDRGWVLVDTALATSGGAIRTAAAERFGEGARPSCIVLTHGHFDHVGAVKALADEWDVPVYAHAAERPFLDGRASYPPPDPTVGGGMMAAMSALYPSGPIDLGDRLRTLPADGTVPEMPGWTWIATPGHSPGHVSLWRTADRTLIAGDAVITTRQESAFAVLAQSAELHGPPMYFTPDWVAAKASVRALAALEPELVVSGHGLAMHGAELRAALHKLADDFDAVAVPAQGRYVLPHPSTA